MSVYQGILATTMFCIAKINAIDKVEINVYCFIVV